MGLWAAAMMTCLGCSPPPPSEPGDVSVDATLDTSTDTHTDTPPGDTSTGPTLPFLVSQEVEPVDATLLSSETAIWISPAMGGQRVLVADTTSIRILGPAEPVESPLPEDFDPASISAVAGLAGQRFLVASDDGIFLLDASGVEASLTLSPLTEGLPEGRISDLAVSDSGGLAIWIGHETGLFFWQDDFLHDLTPTGLSVTTPRLALTAAGHAWVMAEKDLYRVEVDAEGFQAWEDTVADTATELAVDRDGNLWTTLEIGGIALRDPDARWFDLSEFGLTRVVASPATAHAWFMAEGQLWHLHGGVLRPTNGPSMSGPAEVDSLGRLLMATPEGILRVSPGRSIAVEGFPPEHVIASLTYVTVTPGEPALVVSIEARVNGEALAAEEDGTFALDPHAMGEGDYAFDVDVIYSDVSVPSTASVAFQVFLPTWEAHIQPLAKAQCVGCHGENASLSVKLFQKIQWENNFEAILLNTQGTEMTAPIMPPGAPLPEELTRLIAYWGEAGFL